MRTQHADNTDERSNSIASLPLVDDSKTGTIESSSRNARTRIGADNDIDDEDKTSNNNTMLQIGLRTARVTSTDTTTGNAPRPTRTSIPSKALKSPRPNSEDREMRRGMTTSRIRRRTTIRAITNRRARSKNNNTTIATRQASTSS